MMKKILSVFESVAALLVVIMVVLGVVGSNEVSAKAEYKQYVFDDANILDASEEAELESLCQKASEECGVDFVIITMNLGLDYEPMDEYLFQYVNYYDFSYDVIAYGIDMTSRADRIITRGRAQTDISQSKLDSIRESAEDELTDGDYFKGCKKFVTRSSRILTNDIWVKLTYDMGIKIIISLVVAVIVVLILMQSAKSRMTVANTTYTRNHQFKVNDARDIFINTTVVTRKIESSSSRGGGGGGGNHGSGGHF